MKNIKVVIGANFGDEGKGITTDYFCKQFSKKEKVLNIRFNGGSQAGHTVVTKDGRRHVFHNFGAGSFNENVTTYLSKYFYLDTIGYLKEKQELLQLGVRPKVIMSTSTNLILPYDIFVNQMVEISRGKDRHGSCGNGIWECIQRTEKAKQKFSPLSFRYTSVDKLKKRILELRDTYYAERLKEYGISVLPEYEEIWNSEQLIINFINDTKHMIVDVILTPEHEIFKEYNNIVFEGAQGLLLDWGNREYMPHLTASYTGLKNVNELLPLIEEKYNLQVCYVTRTYFTRHGAGRFDTETQKENLRYQVNDKTNVYNTWQQNFRWGYLDLPLLIKTIKKDLEYIKNKKYNLSICVTHCDETKNNLVLPEKDLPVEKIKEYIPCKNLLLFSNEITQ